MTEFSIYRGAGLDSERFAAAAYLDAEEAPDEPGTTSVLLGNDPGEGWTRIDVVQDRVTSLAALDGEAVFGSERRRLYGLGGTTPLADLGDRIPTKLSALVPDGTGGLWLIADHGHFYRGSPSGGFAVVAPELQQPPLRHDMSVVELTRQMTLGRYVYNAARLGDGRILLCQIGGLGLFDPAAGRIELLGASAAPVDVAALPDGTAFTVAHSPRVTIARFQRGEGLAPLFSGATEARQTACIAGHDQTVWVGDSHPATGGLYRLGREGLVRVVLPEDFGSAPVFDLDVVEGVLWVFRAKDVLRLAEGAWTRLTPEDPS